LVAQNARCSIVLQPTFRRPGKTGLAAASPHHRRTRARGQIPIAPAALLPPTSRDFVPWRFSDAGRWSAWIIPPSRHPKTCTFPDTCTAAKVDERWITCRRESRVLFRLQTCTVQRHITPRLRMSVVECDGPSGSALGIALIERADFSDAYRAPLRRPEAG